eukprot:snap_masked-scaffold_4-processed-gene-0.22-mRNA-1 protein AED:1.00 eAED:1.00 QI:0/-1/0/0/-1/1/1/0/446
MEKKIRKCLLELTALQNEHEVFKKHFTQTKMLYTDGLHKENFKVLCFDCEMVECFERKLESQKSHKVVARVSLLQLNVQDLDAEFSPKALKFTTLVNTFVKIDSKFEVNDYLTYVSGVRKEDLEGADVPTRTEVESMLDTHISTGDLILGHSLESDFSVITIFKKVRVLDSSPLYKSKETDLIRFSLHDLTNELLGEKSEVEELAQNFENLSLGGMKEHDPNEDAKNSAKLVLLAVKSCIKEEKVIFPFLLEEFPRDYRKRLVCIIKGEISNACNSRIASSLEEELAKSVSRNKFFLERQRSECRKDSYGKVLKKLWYISFVFSNELNLEKAVNGLNIRKGTKLYYNKLYQRCKWITLLNGQVSVEIKSPNFLKNKINFSTGIYNAAGASIGRIIGKRGCNLDAVKKKYGVGIDFDDDQKQFKVFSDSSTSVEDAIKMLRNKGKKF